MPSSTSRQAGKHNVTTADLMNSTDVSATRAYDCQYGIWKTMGEPQVTAFALPDKLGKAHLRYRSAAASFHDDVFDDTAIEE